MSFRRVTFALAVSAASFAACSDGAGFPDARTVDAAPPTGTFSLSWSLDDGGTTRTCAEVGATFVSLSARASSAAGGFTEVFSCSSGMGTSRGLAPGPYDITVTLTSAAGPLVTLPPIIEHVVSSSTDAPVPPLVFEVEARGNIELTVSADVDGNCLAAGPDGAGLEQMTLRLTQAGTCVPTTFAIAAGATTVAGTYVDPCDNQPLGLCIERDQVISVTDAPTGAYVFTATGLVGGNTCYSGTRPIDVPAQGGTETVGAFMNATGACN